MADFASLIGGNGDTVPVGSADPNLAFAYFWNAGNISINIGAGNDIWDSSGAAGNTSVFAGTGDDSVTGGVGNDLFSGQDGDDQIYAGAGNNTVAGGTGDDAIQALGGRDILDGGLGDDTILAGAGNDIVFGGDGADQLQGEAGNDLIYGGSGDDSILGGTGDDLISGMSGKDFIVGGAGDDTLYGGSDDDVFFFDSNFGADVVKDMTTGDQIFLTSNINGSGISAPQDLVSQNLIGGGVDPATNQPFTTITIGADTIRIENMNQADFSANVSTWVKIV